EIINKFVAHFHEVFEQIDRQVGSLFDEAVADGEDVEKFVYAKLKLRSYEIFQSFDRDNQHELLSTIDELIYADGSVHPSEAKFRAEIEALLDKPTPPIALGEGDIEVIANKQVAIQDPAALRPRLDDHPFFQRFEQHYSSDPDRIRSQVTADLDLMHRFVTQLGQQRAKGAGKLAGKQSVTDFAGEAPFLDGHVYVHPAAPGQI